MKTERENENVKEADTLECRQGTLAPNYEKGSSDQKFPEVGHTNDRKGDGPPAPDAASARSAWFDDKTIEIGTGWTLVKMGWIYRRTETGHRRERCDGRGSVSKLHSSEARPL